MAQPLWETVLQKFDMKTPHDPDSPPRWMWKRNENMQPHKDLGTHVHPVLFIKAKKEKQPQTSTKGQINDTWDAERRRHQRQGVMCSQVLTPADQENHPQAWARAWLSSAPPPRPSQLLLLLRSPGHSPGSPLAGAGETRGGARQSQAAGTDCTTVTLRFI